MVVVVVSTIIVWGGGRVCVCVYVCVCVQATGISRRL